MGSLDILVSYHPSLVLPKNNRNMQMRFLKKNLNFLKKLHCGHRMDAYWLVTTCMGSLEFWSKFSEYFRIKQQQYANEILVILGKTTNLIKDCESLLQMQYMIV